MKFYHATSHENAEQLLAQGASPAAVGTGGGLQAGWGFYLAPDMDAAEYWQDRIGAGWADTILTVAVPDTARIATEAEVDGLDREAAQTWLRAAGLIFVDPDGKVDGPASAAALRAHFNCPDSEYLGYGWLQIAAYLRAQGYDGYVSRSGMAGTVVVLNLDLLGATAFSAE